MHKPHRRGRKKRHGSPLTAVEATAAMRTLAAVRKTEKWNEAETRRRAFNAVDLPKIQNLPRSEVDKAEFDFDIGTFKKVINVDLSLNDHHKWGIFLWMREYYGNDLKKRILEETLKQKEKLLHSFNKLLGFDELNTEIASAIKGHYDLYRPLYSSPDKILVQRFVVSTKESIFDCSLSGTYETSPGRTITDRFVGKIVPQGERVAAVLRIPNNFKGMMILHFDDLDIASGGDEVQTMGGLMMTAIGNGRSSAWPIYARRVHEEEVITHAIITQADFHLIPDDAVEAMQRGAVHWNSKHYGQRTNHRAASSNPSP